jgi:hypothetical protein
MFLSSLWISNEIDLEYMKLEWDFNWLPGLVTGCVLTDRFPCHLPSLEKRCRREAKQRLAEGTSKVSLAWP